MARDQRPSLDPLGYGPYDSNLLGEKMYNDAAKSIDRAVARKGGKPMRLFKLLRHEDESGVSGTGVVAEGVVFSDGSVAVRWLGEYASTITYMSIGDVEQVHGHNGKTEVVYL